MLVQQIVAYARVGLILRWQTLELRVGAQVDPDLKAWCNRKTVARFLVARKWNVDAATFKLQGTLAWYAPRPRLVTAEAISGAAAGSDCSRLVSRATSAPLMLVMLPHRRAAARPGRITWQEVRQEAESGKLFILPGKDKSGRPMVVFRPRYS